MLPSFHSPFLRPKNTLRQDDPDRFAGSGRSAAAPLASKPAWKTQA